MSAAVAPWNPPPGPEPREDACGTAFDAVVMPDVIAWFILYRLGARSGAVIEDRDTEHYFWLIRPGTGRLWPIPSVRTLAAGESIRVPPPLPMPGARLKWRVPLSSTCYLTDADHLGEALALEWAPFEANGAFAALRAATAEPPTTNTPAAVQQALRDMRRGRPSPGPKASP